MLISSQLLYPTFHLLICLSPASFEGRWLKTEVTTCHESWYVFEDSHWLGQARWHPKNAQEICSLAWCSAGSLFPLCLHFQSKELTSVHVPCAGDARQTTSGWSPCWKGSVSQPYQRPGTSGTWGQSPTWSPCKASSSPADRNQEGSCAPTPHTQSSFVLLLFLQYWELNLGTPCHH